VSTRREREITREARKEAWQGMEMKRMENMEKAHAEIMKNEVFYVCPEHGESHIEFSFISEGVGIINSKPSCPICGNDEGTIRSSIPYRVEIPQRWSEEEY